MVAKHIRYGFVVSTGEAGVAKGFRGFELFEKAGILKYLKRSERIENSRDLGPASTPDGSLSRRRFLRMGVGILAGTGAASAGYGAFIERKHLIVRRVEIPLERLPEAWDGLMIAQLSDLHYHPYWSADVIQHAIEVTNSLKPDVIALTGDYVTVPFRNRSPRKLAWEIEPCTALLRVLSARLGVFAVLGNHDAESRPNHISEVLGTAGIRVLRNAAFPLERNGRRVWMVGLEDALYGNQDLGVALKQVPASETSIALVHEPDYADEVSRSPVDLQLSGHSHGGQIRVPVVMPLYLPYMARKYPIGLYTVGRMKLYTNSGLGTIRVPIRLFAPPEVTLFALRVKKG